MTTRRRSRLLTKITITARRHRELAAAFRAEMQSLRRRLKEPHPRETFEQFTERLFTQFEGTLARYHDLGMFGLMLRTPARDGRRPSLAKEPKGASGRPRRDLAEHVATIAARDSRPIPDVARELLRDHWKKHEPRQYSALMALAEDCQDHAQSYLLAPRRALTRAFGDQRFSKKLKALIRSSQNHAKNGHSAER